MVDAILVPHTPFTQPRIHAEGIALSAPTGLALVSIATPAGLRENLAKVIETVYGISMPEIGASCLSDNGTERLVALQPEQLFLLFDYEGDRAVDVVAGKLGEVAYYTDQSDSWAMLRLSGSATLAALERISMLDFDLAGFAVDAVARTIMDHLNVIILRESVDSFLLMSPRSSAHSFLRVIELSIAYTS